MTEEIPGRGIVERNGGVCRLCGCAMMKGDQILIYELRGETEHRGCRRALTKGTMEWKRSEAFWGRL